MDKNIETYLEELTKCDVSQANNPDVPNCVRINGKSTMEYTEEMNSLFNDFHASLLASSASLQIADFAKIEQVFKVCQANIVRLEKMRFANAIPFIGYALEDYKRQVERCSAFIEEVKMFKIAHISGPAISINAEPIPEVQPESAIQPEPKKEEEVPDENEAKEPRRSFNDKGTSHPGEYWGFKEMEEGEGIAHSTACKISKDPDLQPAFRYVGRAIRVDIAKLHELQRKKTAEKNKPIGNNPRKHKKAPTL